MSAAMGIPSSVLSESREDKPTPTPFALYPHVSSETPLFSIGAGLAAAGGFLIGLGWMVPDNGWIYVVGLGWMIFGPGVGIALLGIGRKIRSR